MSVRETDGRGHRMAAAGTKRKCHSTPGVPEMGVERLYLPLAGAYGRHRGGRHEGFL